jgi:gag-polypeptide of LTR copia-type
MGLSDNKVNYLSLTNFQDILLNLTWYQSRVKPDSRKSHNKITTRAKGKIYQYKEISAGLSYNPTGNQVPVMRSPVPEQLVTLLEIKINNSPFSKSITFLKIPVTINPTINQNIKMTEENPNLYTFENQISTFLRCNSELNASQKLTNVPLNEKNYIPWAKAARVTLKGKGLLGYINGNKVRPIFGVEAQEEWEMLDSQVMTLITNSIQPQLSEEFYYCEIATELWQEIQNQYSNQKEHSQVYQLK